jgi:putative sigma-54 modulation protein
MRLTISGHHVEVTDGLREHISKKLRRVQRHCDTIDHIEFVLVVERAKHKAEANLHLAGADFFASETLSDMYPAFAGLFNWAGFNMQCSPTARSVRAREQDHANSHCQWYLRVG